jgi:hypothetical protein
MAEALRMAEALMYPLGFVVVKKILIYPLGFVVA